MNLKRELLIVGSSGMAKETAQLARQIDPRAHRWSSIAYVEKSAELIGKVQSFGKIAWLDDDVFRRVEPADVVLGIGHPKLRRKLANLLTLNKALTFPNLVHPSVEIDPKVVRMGRGNIVTKGVVMTCDIVIGDFNLFNWNVTIGHDARIGSFNVLNPGVNLSGNTELADACLLGTGSQIIESLHIVSGVTVGAGAVVVRSIDTAGTYLGVPALRKP